MPLNCAARLAPAARPCSVAVLSGLLCIAPVSAQDDAPDLLFNCQLAGVKRVYLVSQSRGTLFDQGNEHPAQLRKEAVTAEWLQPWSERTNMRHRLHVGRIDGVLTYQVDELDEDGKVMSQLVSETGICSREKIHPRNFK